MEVPSRAPLSTRLVKTGLALLLAAPLMVQAQVTTIFNDSFNSGGLSTLNPTATSPGTLTSTRTAYEIASSKSATATTIASGVLTLGNFSTSSGYCEAQAMFTASPVTLTTPGQYIECYYTITAQTTVFNGNANDNEQLSIGLYNSGTSLPTNGTALWNSGLAAVTTGDIGCTKGWIGYNGEFAYSKATTQASSISTRPAQTGANNLNQGLCPVSGYSSAVNLGQISGVLGQPALTQGSQYTVDIKIMYVNATTLAITNTLYVGAGIGGAVYSAGGFTAATAVNVTGANLLTTTFDGLCIGFRPTSSPTTAETDKINNVTVLLVTPIAPSITGLTNQTVIAGTSPTLSPTVTGVPPPAYQWQTNGVNIGGATNATLPLPNVQFAQNGWQYLLVATNQQGSVSNSMTLTVIVTPGITSLSDQSVSTGSTVTMSPTVSGVPTPTTQWQYNGVYLTDGVDGNGSTIAGSSTSTLSITGAVVADGGVYSLVASNSAGIVTNSMNLTVSSGNTLPVVTGPTNITVIQGNNATFSASATGLPLPTLQWLDPTQTPIPGATSTTLTLNNVQYSQNGSVYYFVASNSVGSVTNNATLTVIVAPAITTQPSSLTVTNTQSATFSVVASGVPSPGYQWFFNNVAIGGATGSSYTIPSASPANVGTYYVVITNAAGTVTSSNATLAVNSVMSAVAFAPANGATGLCYDTPLTVTFNSNINLGTNATIRIYNVTNSTTPVDTINASLGLVQQRTFPGDGQSFSYQTISISGSTAVIYPHFNAMTSNQTYYVTIDNGAFTDLAGANFLGISATNTWQFSTKVGGPVNPLKPVVSADGSADFLTVQGAINAVPSGTTTPNIVNIRNGTYTEIVDVTGRTNVVLRGQSRLGTLIGFPNNATFQAVNSGTTHARMALKVNANDIALDNLTVSNMTPQGGSQAEALMIESSALRCIVNNCDIVSRQDTILANVNTSQGYFYKSTVRGNFDYIWGGGNLYFDHCVMDTVTGVASGNLTAARTTTSATQSTTFPWLNPGGSYTANGMSFVNCAFTADTGAGTATLAGANGTAGELVSWYGCDFATNYIAPSGSLFSGNFLLWQDNNTMTNSPVSFPGLITLSGNDPRLLAATNIPTWFYGWNPALAPNIVTQPVGLAVTAGQPATFTAAATGIPDPTYQWLDNGVPISGATASSYSIPSAVRTNGGSYSVVVNNGSGTVTSSAAVLTYNNTAPVAGPTFTMGALLNIPATVQIVGGPNTPTDVDGDVLTLTGVTGAANGTTSTDGSNVTYTATSGLSDSFVYTVSDGFGGTATQTVNVVINPNTATYNQLLVGSSTGGTNVFSFLGNPSAKYALDMTFDLTPPINWQPQGTNTAAIDGTMTFTNIGSAPQAFFRSRLAQ